MELFLTEWSRSYFVFALINTRTHYTNEISFLFFRSEDSEIGSVLPKILSECQQEVPEFLTSGGVASGGGAGPSGFGGVDIRGGAAAVQINAADDEDW